MKRFLILLLSLFMMISFIGCEKKKTDAIRFKEEYEALNGQKNENGTSYLTITIPDKNKVKYIEKDQIVEALENGTHVVYMGYADCPYCRSCIPVLLNTVNDYSGIYIYYYSIKQARSEFEQGLDSELAKLYKEIDASLKKDDFDLSGYVSYYEDGTIKIPASLILFIKEGEIVGAHKRTVESHLDTYEPLDESQMEELTNIYKWSLDEMVRKVAPGCNDEC